MEKSRSQEDHSTNFIRLDGRTTISLMASIVYSLADLSVESEEEARKKSVEIAFLLDRMVGDHLRKVRSEKEERLRKMREEHEIQRVSIESDQNV